MLTASSGVGTNARSCKYFVDALDSDLVTAAKMATRILFKAIRDPHPPLNYKGIAQATISSAESLYGLDAAWKVTHAWYAVSLLEEAYFEGLAPSVEPAREAERVYPWTRFTWPAFPDEDTWDFQLSVLPFDTTILHEKSQITTTEDHNGIKIGVYDLALPRNLTSRFFWRVRPSSSPDAWTDCYIIHSFKDTGEPEEVDRIEIFGEEYEDPYWEVPEGLLSANWSNVRGATKFKTFIGREDPDCDETRAEVVMEHTAPVGEDNYLPLGVAQPQELYWVNIQPIGPDSAVRPEDRIGKCSKRQYKTLPMEPPVIVGLDEELFDFHGPQPVLEWYGSPSANRWRIELFARTSVAEGGNCETTRAFFDEVSGATTALDPMAFPLDFLQLPNPTGYCCAITAIADNLRESPPAEGSFAYYHATLDRTPGKEMLCSGAYCSEILDPHSYEQPITFAWDTQHPEALHYVMKVARFPWTYSLAGPYDPLNATPPGFYPLTDEILRVELPGPPDPLSGSNVSEGRYCWAVWPVLPGPRQPLVQTQPFCYTTGPAEPVLVPPPPLDGGFTGDPISGTFEFKYVPDGQFIVYHGSTEADPQITYEESGCEPEYDYAYDDIYYCTVRFTIMPKEGELYEVAANTYHYGPDAVHHVTTGPLAAGVCGGATESCCQTDSPCDNNALKCNSDGKCEPCGVPGRICCDEEPGPYPCAQGNCVNDICQPCGGQPGNPCCDRGTPCRDGKLSCDSSTNECVLCGLLGNPCCPAPTGRDPCTEGECRDGVCADDTCDDSGIVCPAGIWADACCPGHACVYTSLLNLPGGAGCGACGQEGQRCCHTAQIPPIPFCNSTGIVCAENLSTGGDWCLKACGGEGESCCFAATPQEFCTGSRSCTQGTCH